MIRKISAVFLLAALCALALLSLCACTEHRGAHALMEEFCTGFGIDSAIYSPDVREGSAGFVYEGFFEGLYTDGEEWVSDFAVVLLSTLELASECGVFICYTDFDAVQVTDMLHRRIELLRSVAAVSGLGVPEDMFVYREGRTVVMCALPRAEEARELWRAIL